MIECMESGLVNTVGEMRKWQYMDNEWINGLEVSQLGI